MFLQCAVCGCVPSMPDPDAGEQVVDWPALKDRLQWLSDMSDEERGFRMPVGRSTKTYASAEGGRGSEAWNDGRRSAGPGFAPTDEMARLCATVMKKAAAAFGGAGGSSIRTLHHRKNK